MNDLSAVRAGAFVVAALAVLVVSTIWIAGGPASGGQVDYEVQMNTSGGVRRGDRVRLSGMEVGRVKGIELLPGDENPVLFEISVSDEIELTEGTSARLTTDGLLGAPYLEIVAGSPEGVALADGTRILGSRSADLNDTLGELGASTERLPLLLDQTSQILTKVDRELEPLLLSLNRLLSDENIETVSRILGKLEPTVEDVGSRLSTLAEHLDNLAGELEEGLGGVPELTTDLRGLVTDLRSAVGPDGERLSGVLESASTTLGTADGALSTIELNSDEMDAMLRDLRESAANLRSLSQTLKERPSLLLRFPEPPDRKPGEEE